MVVLLLAAVTVLRVFDGDPDASYGTAELEEHLDQHPGVPMVLPVRLPPGYEWRGVESWISERGRVTQRGTTFVPGEAGTGAPFVSLCVERPGAPAHCPAARAGMRRTVAGLRVVITFEMNRPTTDELEFWRAVPLRAQHRGIDWLE